MIYIGYEESWIYIKGNRTKYKILDNGIVLNTDTGKEMCGGRDKNGYHIVSLTYKKKKYTRKVHRLVAKAFIPNPENKPEVNHKNGDKWNNDVSNLEWSTSVENTHHALSTGLRKSVLNEEKVIQICEMIQDGRYKSKQIAKKLGVDKRSVLKILCRVNWNSISKNYDFSKYDRSHSSLKTGGNNCNKISTADAKIICERLSKGESPIDISNEMNISRSIVSLIKRRKTWKHISCKYDF